MPREKFLLVSNFKNFWRLIHVFVCSWLITTQTLLREKQIDHFFFWKFLEKTFFLCRSFTKVWNFQSLIFHQKPFKFSLLHLRKKRSTVCSFMRRKKKKKWRNGEMEKNNWRREGAETWFQVKLLFVCLRFLFFLKCWEILAPSLLMCCCSSRRWRNQFNRFFFTFFFLTKTGKYKKAAAPFKQTQLLKLQLLKRLFAIFKRNKKKSRFVCQRASFIVTQWRQQKKKVPFCVFFVSLFYFHEQCWSFKSNGISQGNPFQKQGICFLKITKTTPSPLWPVFQPNTRVKNFSFSENKAKITPHVQKRWPCSLLAG